VNKNTWNNVISIIEYDMRLEKNRALSQINFFHMLAGEKKNISKSNEIMKSMKGRPIRKWIPQTRGLHLYRSFYLKLSDIYLWFARTHLLQPFCAMNTLNLIRASQKATNSMETEMRATGFWDSPPPLSRPPARFSLSDIREARCIIKHLRCRPHCCHARNSRGTYSGCYPRFLHRWCNADGISRCKLPGDHRWWCARHRSYPVSWKPGSRHFCDSDSSVAEQRDHLVSEFFCSNVRRRLYTTYHIYRTLYSLYSLSFGLFGSTIHPRAILNSRPASRLQPHVEPRELTLIPRRNSSTVMFPSLSVSNFWNIWSISSLDSSSAVFCKPDMNSSRFSFLLPSSSMRRNALKERG